MWEGTAVDAGIRARSVRGSTQVNLVDPSDPVTLKPASLLAVPGYVLAVVASQIVPHEAPRLASRALVWTPNAL